MKKLAFYEKIYSRWLILLIDQFIVNISILLSVTIVAKLNHIHIDLYILLLSLLICHSITVSVFVGMRIHTGIIRYSNIEDVSRVFFAVFFSNLLLALLICISPVNYRLFSGDWLYAVLVLNFLFSACMLTALRLMVKTLYHYLQNFQFGNREIVMIYGADAASLLINQGLESSGDHSFSMVGFIDDNPDKVHKHICQKSVYPISAITDLKRKYALEKMIVMEEDTDLEGRRKAIDACLNAGVRVISVPASGEWLKGKLKLSKIPDLKIEDLLQRKPIELDAKRIMESVSGKKILITGAAGSIGSEIVRQVLTHSPELIILCDQAETALHDIQLELDDTCAIDNRILFMANIQNEVRLRHLFETYKPNIVFHAAALKHVPMMEVSPSEAVLTNVLGTRNLADLSIEYKVDKFIMISTDKAVKPTNVMGASKRIAEIYIQALHERQLGNPHQTKFITTRFGNVLGSNGSVVPRFKSQIEAGGPVTVTHPDITRYFMTIPEAVQLVLEASAMGRGGEIFIFDMGNPVKITELAENMIRLAGFIPHKEIKIAFTGLRPGEKLYEELLNQKEMIMPTYHEKIKISQGIRYPYLYIHGMIEELLLFNSFNDNLRIVRKMMEVIPEFKSTNSAYLEERLKYNHHAAVLDAMP